MKLVSVEEMQTIEADADRSGLSYEEMMRRAGQGLAELVDAAYRLEEANVVLGLVGPGNNGGDTLIALTELSELGWKANAYLLKARRADDALLQALRASGGALLTAEEDPGFEHLQAWVMAADVILDGLLGTGFQLPLKAEVANLLNAVCEVNTQAAVVAVDCPSGVDSQTGQSAPETLPADLTVCMAAVKQGLLAFPAFNLVGDLAVVDLGFSNELESWRQVSRQVLTADWVQQSLPARPRDAHKGTFGTALLAVGSVNYTGAAVLAAEAVYRSGAGLVRLAVPDPLYRVLAGQILEATWLPLPVDDGVIAADAAGTLAENLHGCDVLLLGCGWGTKRPTAQFLQRLLRSPSAARRSGLGFVGDKSSSEQPASSLPPMVIDADGLRLLAQIDDWPAKLPPGSILTPHPGEMAALSGLTTAEVQSQRLDLAQRLAQEWGQVIVLKGASTVIASPDGRAWVAPVATPALASAGTGDVLAGLITGLRAQGLSAEEAACCGAWIHAQAGLAAEQLMGSDVPVMAGDVLALIASVWSDLQL